MLIKNALIKDKEKEFFGDLLVKDGIISKVGSDLGKCNNYFDAKGKMLTPSFIDLHSHFRDPGYTNKEDLLSASKAAAHGGFTACVTMANTNPVCDSAGVYKDILSRSKDIGLVDVYPVIAISKNLEGKELVDFESLPDTVMFLSDDGKGVMSNHMMFEAMKKAKDKNLCLMVHEEDMEISPYDYRTAEDIMTLRDMYLSEITGAWVHFSHVSTKKSIELIRFGKSKGLNITCEVTPHHLILTDSTYRVNPPIRKVEDVNTLIQGLNDGIIDGIGTDHAPHTIEDKKKGAPGMIGIEFAFSLLYSKLVLTRKTSLSTILRALSYGPGRIIREDHGLIKPGARANLTLVDLEKEITIDENFILSKSKNTPFLGEKLYGQVIFTMKDGKFTYGG